MNEESEDRDQTTDSGANDDKGESTDNGGGFFVATYKDKEAAEKGLREKDDYIGKLKQELDSLKQTSKTDQILAKLTDAVAKRDEPGPDQSGKEWEAILADWDAGSSKKQLAIIEALVSDRAKQTATSIEQELRKELASLKAAMRDVDPQWLRHKQQVVELAQKTGLDPEANRDLLLKIVAATAPKSDRIQPPTELGETRTATVSKKAEAEMDALIDSLAKDEGWKVSAEERAELKAKWARSQR